MLKSKFSKLAMLLGASLMLTSFIACSSDDDDDDKDTTEKTEKTDDSGKTGSKATAKTYNFVGLSFSDFPEESLTKKADGSTVLTELGSETQPYLAKNTIGVSVADATIVTGNSKRISVRFTDGASTAINIGNSNMGSATAAAADNYIKISAPAAGTVTLTYKITAATAADKTGASNATAALTTAEDVLASKTYDTTYETYSSLDDDAKKAAYNDQTLTATLNAAGDVYVGYFRGAGANTGNIDVYKI